MYVCMYQKNLLGYLCLVRTLVPPTRSFPTRQKISFCVCVCVCARVCVVWEPLNNTFETADIFLEELQLKFYWVMLDSC